MRSIYLYVWRGFFWDFCFCMLFEYPLMLSFFWSFFFFFLVFSLTLHIVLSFIFGLFFGFFYKDLHGTNVLMGMSHSSHTYTYTLASSYGGGGLSCFCWLWVGRCFSYLFVLNSFPDPPFWGERWVCGVEVDYTFLKND